MRWKWNSEGYVWDNRIYYNFVAKDAEHAKRIAEELNWYTAAVYDAAASQPGDKAPQPSSPQRGLCHAFPANEVDKLDVPQTSSPPIGLCHISIDVAG